MFDKKIHFYGQQSAQIVNCPMLTDLYRKKIKIKKLQSSIQINGLSKIIEIPSLNIEHNVCSTHCVHCTMYNVTLS